jgi:molybdenum cofactor cytidylyltransferase
MIVHVILAAGAGSRVGGNKGALEVGGRPLLARLLDAAAASKVDRTLVVVGAEAERTIPLCARPKVAAVRNDAWRSGQTSSLQAALRALPPACSAFLVHPVDHCLVDAAVLDALADAFVAADAPARATLIARPTFDGGWGHPVLYAAGYAPEFLALGPDEPGRKVYRAHLDRVVGVPVRNGDCLFDLDTPEDLAAVRRRLG